jgi:hypothetical protein
MRRIRPQFAPLFETFSKTDLPSAVHTAILVDVTDDRRFPFFEDVPNNDGFFQILAGCDMKDSDQELTKEVLDIIRKAATAYPFSEMDKEKVISVFDAAEETLIINRNQS